MATAGKRVNTLVTSGSTYIDPVGCDSTISYKIINRPRHLYGSVQLADCNHKIEWYFGGVYKDSLAKADKAIATFQEFRDALAAAQLARPKRVRRATVKK